VPNVADYPSDEAPGDPDGRGDALLAGLEGQVGLGGTARREGHGSGEPRLVLDDGHHLGERRVAEPRKVSGLFAGERAYYREVYAALLAERDDVSPLGGGRLALPPADSHANARAERFIARSRRRGVMRWPKYLLTVDGWLEIQLEKLERHHGIALQLDERTRRWPLIFGWPKFFELVRRGVIK
ncbi:MAG: hypothetical protein KC503_13820, partial [Myxococcales bacterium]|nr:hypothetical protein [Myxococcales bacterium]